VRRRPVVAAVIALSGAALLGLLASALFYEGIAISVVAVVGLLVGAGWYSARLKAALHRLDQQHLRAERSVERLHLLLETTPKLMTTQSLDELLRLLTETTILLANAERATIYLVDEQRRELWSKVALGDGVGEIRVPLGSGIAGTVAVTGEIINLDDPYKSAQFNPDIDRRTGFRTRSLLTLPMRSQQGRIVGVFQVLNKRGGAFVQEDIEMLQMLALTAAVAVEKARA
jgi:serine/threonine-protein kinase